MAHLYRPTYTRPVPASAEIVTVNRVRFARWRGRKDREFLAPLCEGDPSKCRVEIDCWWCEYEDHKGVRRREKCYADRLASETKMLEIRQRIDRIRSGDVSEGVQRRLGRDLADLIAEWKEDMEGRDVSAGFIALSLARVNRVVSLVKAGRPADLTDTAVARVLRKMRDRPARPVSAKTSNHYQAAVHSFLLWCVKEKCVESDPMAAAKALEVDSRKTFERRALTIDEVTRLIAATRKKKRPGLSLDSHARAMLYLTAVYTGFRLKELASLTKASFRLDPPMPQIDLHGRSSKNKKGANQPVPEPVAGQLREWLATLPDDGPVWKASRWSYGGAAFMLRGDLKAAGIPPNTEQGRVDFHSLRTTFGTLLALSGVPIQHAQRLMRHSNPAITMRHYTKLLAGDLAGQLGKLPVPDA